MSWGDVRGLLQYVPQFRGKVFVVVVDSPVPALAEIMLDLRALQGVGIQLAIGSTVHSKEHLLDRAAEVELKYSQSVSVEGQQELVATLNRGQAIIADFSEDQPLSEDIASFAASLSAQKLILLHGVGDVPAQGAIRAADISAKAPDLLAGASKACEVGIPRVHILDGNVPAVLLDEIFSNEGVGTMVYADSYRVIRPLREEDIVELLGMISRSVRRSTLVPRTYHDIEANISDYSVMDIDGNVVGSVALHHYSGFRDAEIACLYVKQAHEGRSYGQELVGHAEEQAKLQGVEKLFALTNSAASFFGNQLGYEEQDLEVIPEPRIKQLLASSRDSRVFVKEIE